MTKIIFCVNTLGNGGAERVIANLAEYFSKDKNFKVYLLCNYHGDYKALLGKNVEIIDISSKLGKRTVIGWRFVNSVKTIAEELKRVNPDIVISSLPDMCTKVALAKNLYRLKFKYIHRETNIVFATHLVDYIISPLKSLGKRLYSYSFNSAELIIANSEDTKNSIKTCHHISDRKIVTLPNPVISTNVIDNYEAMNIEDHEFPKRKYILSVGRLVEQKGYDILIKAYSEMLKKGHKIDLVILGDGPLRYNLLSLCEELGCEESVHILHFRKNVYDYYQRCELFALSSRFEGFGNVIVEALAFGKPVVATTCEGGPHYILKEGDNGILVPVGDIMALRDAMLNIVEGKIMFDAKKQKERARYFSIERVSEEYKKIIMRRMNKNEVC